MDTFAAKWKSLRIALRLLKSTTVQVLILVQPNRAATVIDWRKLEKCNWGIRRFGLLLGYNEDFSLLQGICWHEKELRRTHCWFCCRNYCDGFYFNVRCSRRCLLFCVTKIKYSSYRMSSFKVFIQNFFFELLFCLLCRLIGAVFVQFRKDPSADKDKNGSIRQSSIPNSMNKLSTYAKRNTQFLTTIDLIKFYFIKVICK